MLPYLVYMLALYVLVTRVKLIPALLGATLCWAGAALVLVVVWNGL